ncbi:MAG: hypothetical protein HY905_08715 [Deltaproteobacteria bacterium]|nr:hypothetical protein [Deltaproteobacteria bacterium]
MELLRTDGMGGGMHWRGRTAATWLALFASLAACGRKQDATAGVAVPADGSPGAAQAALASAAIVVPFSTTREAYAEPDPIPGTLPRSVVTVSADAVRCGGRTVAAVRTAVDGRRTLEEAARTGGDEGSLLPDLRACLVAQRLDRDETERRTGHVFLDKKWLLVQADRATPMRILEDVLYTASEADRDRLQLQLRPWVAGAEGRPDTGSLGTVTLLPAGSADWPGAGHPSTVRLRLAARVSADAVTLHVARELAADLLPDDPTVGLKGSIRIAHQRMTVQDVEKEAQGCRPPSAPPAFDDCAYWTYLESYLRECAGESQGPAEVPDLKTFNLQLRAIAERAALAFGDRITDGHVITLQVQDEVPYCQVVALLDFARFVSFSFDWTTDEPFANAVTESMHKGVNDPMLEPPTWNEAMARQLLFPIVRFLRWSE